MQSSMKRRAVWLWACAGMVVGAMVSPATMVAARAQGGVEAPGDGIPHVHGAGCGKSEAALRRFRAGLSPSFGGGANPFGDRAAAHLAETDLIHNLLDFEVKPTTKTLTGSNTMTLKSKVALESGGLLRFVFQLGPAFTVTAVTVDGVAVAAPVSLGDNARQITLPRPYGLDETLVVKVSYTGVPVSDGVGSIEFRTVGGQPLVYSLSEPWYAASWFPCKDEDLGGDGDNADKSAWDIHITAPSGLTSVANGALQGIDTLSGSRRKFRYKTNYPMATYLAAFGTSNYNTWNRTYTYPLAGGGTGTMPVQFYISPSVDNSSNRAQWDKAVQMLEAFREPYGLYPFINEKYGIYSFGFGGGMEHQTISGQSGFGEGLTAHELAHQWWGDNVTCRTWRDIWLNEGFATFSEALWEERKPGSAGLSAYKNKMMLLRGDALSTRNAVYKAGTLSDTSIFDYESSYAKGAWILHMLRGALGDTLFFQILREYRLRYEGSAATTAQFFDVVEELSGRSFDTFYSQWLVRNFTPVFTITTEEVTIRGNRYLEISTYQNRYLNGVFDIEPEYLVKVGAGGPGKELRGRVRLDAVTEYHLLPLPAAAGAASLTLDPDTWLLITDTYINPGVVDAPPVLMESSPAPGATVAELSPIDRVTLGFSGDVSLSNANVRVRRDGASEDEPVSVLFDSSTKTATLLFAGTLRPGTYRVEFVGSVTSPSGVGMDGEIGTSLPSGDGVPGFAAGSAVFTFAVAGNACPADLTGDGFVDDADFVQFAAAYEAFTVPPAAAQADLTGDGLVDDADFVQFAEAYELFVCP